MNALTILFAFLICSPLHAGDKAHGTESEKLYLAEVLANQTLKDVYDRTTNLLIKDLENAAEKLLFPIARFVQQVPWQDLADEKVKYDYRDLLEAAQRDIPQPGEISLSVNRSAEPEKAKSLIFEVLRTRFVVQKEPCIDSAKVPREATTEEKPGVTTCVYPRGLALIYTILNRGKLFDEQDAQAFILGMVWHENARKFGLDASHEFFKRIQPEMNLKSLVTDEECWRTKAFCPMLTATGFDLHQMSWAQDVENKLTASVSMPSPDKKEKGEFRTCSQAEKIEKINFVVVTGYTRHPFHGYWTQSGPTLTMDGVPLTPQISGNAKRANDFQLEIEVENFGTLSKSTSGRRNERIIEFGSIFDFYQYMFFETNNIVGNDYFKLGIVRFRINNRGSCVKHEWNLKAGSQLLAQQIVVPRELKNNSFGEYAPLRFKLIERPAPIQ